MALKETGSEFIVRIQKEIKKDHHLSFFFTAVTILESGALALNVALAFENLVAVLITLAIATGSSVISFIIYERCHRMGMKKLLAETSADKAIWDISDKLPMAIDGNETYNRTTNRIKHVQDELKTLFHNYEKECIIHYLIYVIGVAIILGYRIFF